jgi:hypothetical protein
MAHTLNNNHQATTANWLIEWYATSVFVSHALPPAVNFASNHAKYHSSFYGHKP